MSEPNAPNRRARVIERLRSARRPEGEPAPQRREENLRWLLHAAMPAQIAPTALRQRVRILASIDRLWPGSWAGRFLAALLARLCRRGREQRGNREQPDGASAGSDQALLQLLLTADVRRLSEDACVRAEARRVMRRVLARLPDLERESLLLQVVQGLSVTEVARVLARSEAEIESLLLQARAAIFGPANGMRNE